MASQAADAGPAQSPRPQVFPQVKRILAISGSHSLFLFTSVLCGVLLAVLTVASAHVSARMLDSVLAGNMPVFVRMVWFAIAIAGAQSLLTAGKRLMSGKFWQGAGFNLRHALSGRVSRATAIAASSEHSGQVLSKLTGDLQGVQALVETDLPDMLVGLVRGSLAVAYMLWCDWMLALVAVLAAPAVFAIVGRLNAPVMGLSQRTQEALGDANKVAAESLVGAETLRAFGLQDRLYDSFARHTDRWLALSMRTGRIQGAITAVGFGASFTPFILVLGIGGFMVLQGRLGFGSVMAFLELMNHVAFPMRDLPRLMNQMAGEAASAKRVMDLLDIPVEREDGGDFSPDPALPLVEFRNVTFTYPGATTPALAGLSFALHKGEMVALAGASGSGKTSVIRLLLGDYAPDSGEILVFGHQLSEWSPKALRRHFSCVDQSTYLFPYSVAENLRLDRDEIGGEQLREAASLAQAAEFIESLPDGYSTPLGEVGNRVSGGERQRLSLARAMLRRGDIMLLDEATSALDYRSERQVLQGLREHLAGTAMLVIAHRLSSVQYADRILVLSEGRVVEEGTHEQLLALGGKYHELYSIQQEGRERE